MMNSRYRKYLLTLIDGILVLVAYFLGMTLRFNFLLEPRILEKFRNGIIIIILTYIVVFMFFRVYTSIWIYAGLTDYFNLVMANVVSAIFALVIEQFILKDLSVSSVLIGATFALIFTEGIRILYRALKNNSFSDNRKDETRRKVLIIGAGLAGKMLLNEIRVNRRLNYDMVGFVDDDEFKVGQSINGKPILGKTEDIPKLVSDFKIDDIILAIPSLNNSQRKRILEVVSNTKVKMKTLPNIMEIMSKGIHATSIRDVEITDLLGRKEISINLNELTNFYKGRKVLVTGGGGSIGSELCRQIAGLEPAQLIILDIYENNAYEIEMELRRKYPDMDIVALIASVRDREKIFEIFEKYRPEYVIHAAAHKHVPLMETSPGEAVKNNVFGTLNVVQAADKVACQKMLLISTDKAVNPTNIMGATKRLCEMIVQTYSKISKNTDYMAVRFGNVLGSNGSVIPLFKKQIMEGGPVTVTHKDITRFFMTIPEAVQLVLTACTFAKGGEIFVLDMGEPVKIYDLAKNLIKLSGYEPNVDIMIEVTGLRPGEKLYEELLMAEEGLTKTENSLIFIGKPSNFNWEALLGKLEDLKELVDDPGAEPMRIKENVADIVSTYNYEKR